MSLEMKNLPPVDLYKLLGLSREASMSDISKSYRRIALKTHPDHNPGNKKMVEIFKLSTMAYNILSNPRKRAAYDRMTKPSLFSRFISWTSNETSRNYAQNV